MQIREGDRLIRSFEAEIEWVQPADLTAEERAAGAEPQHRAKAPNGEAYDIRVVMSTEAVASDGGIIRASGWNLKRFLRNPVFLWAHDYRELPIGRVVHVEVKGEQLIGYAVFHDKTEFARCVAELFRDGTLRAVSVGFLIRKLRSEWSKEPLTEAEKKAGARWVADEAELLELSAVPVPADAGALKKGVTEADAREQSETATEASDIGDPAPEPAQATDVQPETDTARSIRTDVIERLVAIEKLAREAVRNGSRQ